MLLNSLFMLLLAGKVYGSEEMCAACHSAAVYCWKQVGDDCENVIRNSELFFSEPPPFDRKKVEKYFCAQNGTQLEKKKVQVEKVAPSEVSICHPVF